MKSDVRLEFYTMQREGDPDASLHELLAETREVVEANWQGSDSVMPPLTFALFDDDEVHMVHPTCDIDRSLLMETLHRVIIDLDVTRYAFVLEAWASPRKDVRASQDPNRSEILVLGVVASDGTRTCGRFDIKRDADGRANLCNWDTNDVDHDGWPLKLFGVPDTKH